MTEPKMPKMPKFTIRNVAKFVAKASIAAKVTSLTANLISEHTEYETDDTIVKIGSRLAGWYVCEKLEPVTDAIVDKTADVVTERREQHKAKKAEKKNTEKD